MKKLLLTLLGASLLCGLSPHPLSAQSTQTVSMDLALRTADHNTDLTYTIGETTSPWFDAAVTSPANDKAGFDKIENSDFLIEFDYFDPLAGETGDANVKSNFTTKFTNTSALIPTLNLYPGMRFRITLKDKTKRILSLKIKSGIVSATFTSAYVNYNTHPVASLSEGGNDSKISFAQGTYQTESPVYELTEISFSRSFDGMENGLTLELPKDGCYNIGKANGVKVTTAKTAEFVYNIAGIEAEVMAVADLPKTGRIYGSVADAEVWDEATSTWIRPTQSTYDGNTVKFRTGKVITEFIRTSGAIAGKPTVTYDAASATLGAHVGVDVRSYPDPSVTYKGSSATTYTTEYRLNNPFKSTTLSSAFASSMGLLASSQAPTAANDQWKTGLKKYNDGSSLTLTYVLYSLEADADKKKAIGLSKSIARLSNTFGLSDTTTISIIPKLGTYYPRFQDPTTFINTTIPNGNNANARTGVVPTFVFDEIDLTITTEEATGSRAPSLAAQAADGDIALKQSDGSWLFKSTINIAATLDDEDFPEAKLYYMTGAAPATSFDKSNATEVPADGIIAYNATGFVTVFAVVTVDGKEIASSPASISVRKFESESAATYADLLKIKDGATVTINFTTRTRYTSYINRTVLNTVPYWPFAFVYDNDGNPIKVSAIHLSDLGTTQTHLNSLLTGPGEATSKAKIFVNPAETLDDDKFIEAGSITGRLHLVDGHPEIILVDEFNDDKFDWRDFCGTATKTSAEIGMTAEQKAAADKAFAREYKSTELLPEHWGRFVTIEWLGGYEKTDSTCVDSKANKIHMMYGVNYPAPFGITSDPTNRVASLTKGNSSTRHALTGLVDNRHNSTEMVINVQNLYYHLSKPVIIAKCTGQANALTPRETAEADADMTFDYAYPTTLINNNGLTFTLDREQGQPSTTQVSTITLSYFDLNNNGAQLINNPTTAKPVDGRYLIKVTAKIAASTSSTKAPNIQPAMEESCIVSAYNAVMERVSYFFGDNADLTNEEIERNPYVSIDMIPHTNNDYPTPLVMYPTMMIYDSFANGTIFLAREVRRDMDSEDKNIIPDTDYPRWYIIKSTTKRNPSYYTVSNNKWSSSSNNKLYTGMRAGDAIQRLITKATLNEQGNIIYDNTGAQFLSYCKLISLNDNEKPAFIDEYDELATAVEFNDIAKATIGKEHLNMMVNLPDAVITKDADGEYRVNTATANALAWNILRTDDKDTHTGMIDQAQEGDRFAVKALVVNDGKGGYALEVVDFKAGYARSLHVCDHPSHDSYFAKQNFDGVDAGKQVEMLGVKLTKDAEGKVTTELSSTVSLVWTSFADLEESHKALITGEDRTITFNVAGTLLRGDDGAVSIDVSELTQVKSYGTSTEDYQNMFVINDAPYNPYLNPEHNNIIDYIKVEARGPGYITAYYRYSPTLEGLEDAAEVEFDESRIAKFGKTGYYEFYTCNPGKRGLYRQIPRLFTKTSSNAGSIADILDNGADATSFHYTGHMLITGAARHDYSNEYGEPVTDYVAMATDNDGRHVRLTFRPEYNFIPEAGQYIADLGFFKVNHSDYELNTVHKDINLLATSYFTIKPVEPDEADRIAMPKSIVRSGLDAADKGRRVRLIDMKISGNDTDGYTLTPADGTEPIRLNNVLYWTPAEGFDPDGEYAVEGYVMPAKPADATASLTALTDTEEEVEFWPLYEEAKRQTGKPELKVEGYESVEDNSYVTVEPVKLTAAVVDGPDANAPIEYSIDGGEWTVMTDGTLTVDRSASISVRAHIPGFSPSETLNVEIRREYYSEEAVIAAEPKSGYTAVTFTAGENASADTDFTVYYTLDGTEPDMNSAKFTAGMKPLELTEAVNVKALMVEEGKRPAKSIASQAVAVRANDLEITPEKGEGFTTVTIAPKDPKHVDAKAEIRYTTDGTEPTAQSNLYTAPFEVEAADNGMTVKAICIEPGKDAGTVAELTVAVEGLRPSCDVTITYREEGGVYYITLTAEAGTIHYSLNGAAEKIYDSKPIEYTPVADGTCTITAYALEEGKRAGKTATESFAVTGIAGIGADEAESVRVEGNTIIVPEGAQTFDIAGRRVNPQGLPRGIYIVRLASGKAVKAVVK